MKKLVLSLLVNVVALINFTNASFVDIEDSHPNYKAITSLEDLGIIQGYKTPEGTNFFKPSQEVNRAEALKLLIISSGQSGDFTIGNNFPDVPDGAWFSSFVYAGVSFGIVRGYDDGFFRPENTIRLSEFMKMLSLSFDLEGGAEGREWYEVYQNTLQGLNIVSISADPNSFVTRGEAAEMIYRARMVEANNGERYVVKNPKNADFYTSTYFPDGSLEYYPVDFFDNTTLDQKIPNKVYLGTVLSFTGNYHGEGTPESVQFFFREQEDPETSFFYEGVLSNNDYQVSVPFLDPGKYEMGIIFDRASTTFLIDVEIVEDSYESLASTVSPNYSGEITTQTNEVSEEVEWTWQTSAKGLSEEDERTDFTRRITKITLTQGGLERQLTLESEIKEMKLPFSYFEDFRKNTPLTVTLWQASSEEGSLESQSSKWTQVDQKTYTVKVAYPALENEKVKLENFTKYVKTPGTKTIKGTVPFGAASVVSDVYVIGPDGEVEIHPLQMLANNKFEVEIDFPEEGSYLLEFLDSKRTAIVHQPIYVYKTEILPIKEFVRTEVTNPSTIAGNINWANDIRSVQNKGKMTESLELSEFAQEYAEVLSARGTVEHLYIQTGYPEGALPQGKSYGENLALATSIELGLWGLEFSAAHRQNLINSRWTKMGVGITQNTEGHYIIVHMFSD